MNHFLAVQNLIALTFGVDPNRVTPDTTQADISEWDSVGHLNLMLALEDAFGVTLDVEEMVRLNSVPAILNYLEIVCPSS